MNRYLLTVGCAVIVVLFAGCSWDPPDADECCNVASQDNQVAPASNGMPVAYAGDDREFIDNTEASAVLIDGSASTDPDGDDLYYTWSSLNANIYISDTDRHAPAFTVDLSRGGIFSFLLVVHDGIAMSAPDTVTITVPVPSAPENSIPVADAGENRTLAITQASAVVIDGSASTDADGDQLYYSWNSLNANIDLSETDRHASAFTVDLSAGGVFSFMLVVDDGTAVSAPDVVNITVAIPSEPGNTIPIADAGENRTLAITQASAVVIDGSASTDADGDELHYTWTSLNPRVQVSELDRHAPSFTANLGTSGLFAFMLVVDDGRTVSAPDTVTITVSEPDGWVDDDFVEDDPIAHEFQTIQAAINTVGPNHVIAVMPGLYEERVTAATGIHLLGIADLYGELPEISYFVDSDGDSLSVVHLSSNAILENLTVSCTASPTENYNASIVNVLQDAVGVEIRNCSVQSAVGSVTHYVDGVSIQPNGQLLIIGGSRIEGTSNEKISGEGIFAQYNSYLTIENSRIGHSMGSCIHATGNARLQIENAVIHHAGANGMDIDSLAVSIDHCTVAYFDIGDSGRSGIQIYGMQQPPLTNSLVYSEQSDATYYSGNISLDTVLLSNLPNSTPGSDADPLFTDGEQGDFTLRPGSPAIGSGDAGTDVGAMGDVLLP